MAAGDGLPGLVADPRRRGRFNGRTGGKLVAERRAAGPRRRAAVQEPQVECAQTAGQALRLLDLARLDVGQDRLGRIRRWKRQHVDGVAIPVVRRIDVDGSLGEHEIDQDVVRHAGDRQPVVALEDGDRIHRDDVEDAVDRPDRIAPGVELAFDGEDDRRIVGVARRKERVLDAVLDQAEHTERQEHVDGELDGLSGGERDPVVGAVDFVGADNLVAGPFRLRPVVPEDRAGRQGVDFGQRPVPVGWPEIGDRDGKGADAAFGAGRRTVLDLLEVRSFDDGRRLFDRRVFGDHVRRIFDHRRLFDTGAFFFAAAFARLVNLDVADAGGVVPRQLVHDDVAVGVEVLVGVDHPRLKRPDRRGRLAFRRIGTGGRRWAHLVEGGGGNALNAVDLGTVLAEAGLGIEAGGESAAERIAAHPDPLIRLGRIKRPISLITVAEVDAAGAV